MILIIRLPDARLAPLAETAASYRRYRDAPPAARMGSDRNGVLHQARLRRRLRAVGGEDVSARREHADPESCRLAGGPRSQDDCRDALTRAHRSRLAEPEPVVAAACAGSPGRYAAAPVRRCVHCESAALRAADAPGGSYRAHRDRRGCDARLGSADAAATRPRYRPHRLALSHSLPAVDRTKGTR